LGTPSQQNWKNMGQKSFLFQSLLFLSWYTHISTSWYCFIQAR
jgi:hypothetical protein